MNIPIPIIVCILGGFGAFMTLIIKWGYTIIKNNTNVINKVLLAVERIETRAVGEKELCTEKHKVVNHRIDDLEKKFNQNKTTIMKKLIINIKAAYEAETPKVAKIIGNIGVVILAIALALTTAYPMLPYQFTAALPAHTTEIIGGISFLVTALSKFAFMKQSFQEAQVLLNSATPAKTPARAATAVATPAAVPPVTYTTTTTAAVSQPKEGEK